MIIISVIVVTIKLNNKCRNMFRKKCIVLILASLFSVSNYLNAQDKEKPSLVQFGLKLGPNVGWFKPNSDNYSSEGSVVGFNWGFITEFNVAKNYAINTGFNVVYNNGKLKYPHVHETDTGILQRKYNLQYLEIPICLKMRTNQIGYFTYYGKIGLGVNFNVRAKAKDVFNVDPEVETDIKDEIVFMRESLIVGAGVLYSLGSETSLMFEIIFNNGFTDILKGNNTADPDIKQDAYSSFIEFNIGVIF